MFVKVDVHVYHLELYFIFKKYFLGLRLRDTCASL